MFLQKAFQHIAEKSPDKKVVKRKESLLKESKHHKLMNVYSIYEIVCLVGSSSIMVTKIDTSGRLNRELRPIESPGRIISFSEDQEFRRGTVLLTDSSIND